MKYLTIEQIEQAVEVVKAKVSQSPTIGIILGSGLGELAESIKNAVIIPYQKIPNWPVSTVHGHSGRLVVGDLEGRVVLIMQGRAHYYEGYTMSMIGLPVRVMKRMGIDTLIVTNAAGAVNPDFQPGDLMLITDHLNLIGMSGLNPLRGPNLEEFGPRFPDMSRAYDWDYLELARQVGVESGLDLREGIYASLAGPSFETPADLRFLQMIGVDAVGMSTVPEVTVARHSGMRVIGVSGISNKANLDGSTITTHEEVLAAGKILVPRMTTLVKGVLQSM